MSTTQYIVVNKDDKQEFGFNSMFEAQNKLVELVMLGIGAYIFTSPLYV